MNLPGMCSSTVKTADFDNEETEISDSRHSPKLLPSTMVNAERKLPI